ncbi:hypothetical protein NDN08_002108 [Rhodosorus marinus]|uniref:Glycosyl hydrolase family 98 putative carbohydrate-binding module domain-containing protein n=1 Tax=Rhodosorus marinus TaxID=101924 RepID=A0AAV8UX37_9RHOD|nr:hypothetical protein NDN08_002108 [Rhodosorus marinus]
MGLKLICLLVLVWVGRGEVTVEMENLVHEVAVDGDFMTPIDVDWIPGDVSRMIVCEKRGIIHLAINGVVQSKPFLDISDRIVSLAGRGLISCLIDTQFNKHPFLYVQYVDRRLNTPDDGVKSGKIVRFRVSRDLTRAFGEVVLIGKQVPPATGCGLNKSIFSKDVICLDSKHHNMGGLAMSPSGNIFISLGDAQAPPDFEDTAFRTQDLEFMGGKILCITRTGAPCRSNPFRGGGPNAAKVWNYGLRNPFRISYDRVFRTPLVPQVGYATKEAVFRGMKGLNFGWPCVEGDVDNIKVHGNKLCADIRTGKSKLGTKRALWIYARNEGTAVTGALRLDSTKWPQAIRNRVAVADFTFRWIKLINPSEAGGMKGKPQTMISDVAGVVQIKQGPDGWLYYVSLGAQKIFRVRFQIDKSRPTVVQMTPPQGAKEVEITSMLTVKFSKRINPKAVNGKNIKLRNRSRNQLVRSKLTYLPSTHSVVISPRGMLSAKADYEIVVSRNLMDTQGRKMRNPFRSRFTTGTGFSRFVSDLKWLEAVNGRKQVDVLRDRQQEVEGVARIPPISIRGEEFAKGVAVVADSLVRLALPPNCKRLQAVIGVDDVRTVFVPVEVFFEVRTWSSSKGQKRVFRNARPLTRTARGMSIDVDVRGAKVVALVTKRTERTKPALGIGSWADARFRCGAFDRSNPKIKQVLPAGRIGVKQAIEVVFSEPMDVQSTMDAAQLVQPIALGGYDIGFRASFSADQRRMFIRPSQELLADTEYKLMVRKRAEDLNGNPLTSGIVRTFRTRLEEAVGQKVGLFNLIRRTVRPLGRFNKIEEGKRINIVPVAEVDYLVPGKCAKLTMRVDAVNGARNIAVAVKGVSGRVLCNSGTVNPSAGKNMDCNVRGLDQITIRATGAGGAAQLSSATFDCAPQTTKKRQCSFGRMPSTFKIGDTINYNVKCFDYRGAPVPPQEYNLRVLLVHCATVCHEHLEQTILQKANGSYKVQDHGDFFYLEFQAGFLSDKTTFVETRQIRPQTSTVSVSTMPTGVKVSADSVSGPSPLRAIVVVGSNFTVNALRAPGNTKFKFWEDDRSAGPTRWFIFNKSEVKKLNAVYG